MRITSGRYKGKIFIVPKGIRPTPQRIRKAIFDILGELKDFSFLELFAGSGAVGFEALSKGVKRLVLVESDPRCLRAIYQNIKLLDKGSFKIKVYPLDVERAIIKLYKNKESFEIIFLDPPYLKGLVKKTLQRLVLYDILTPTGFIIVQHNKKEDLPESLGDLILFKQYSYGETKLSFYKKDVSKSSLSR